MSFLTNMFGSRNERVLRQLRKAVQKINALEPEFEKLSDQELGAKTDEFRQRLADGKSSLDRLLPEAFATMREASKRVLGLRHYDVQLIGGMVLHDGKIAEMRTGEGKTLVATLPVYLNALDGKGVHVITVNDYLARRDAAQMGEVYSFLGLSTSVVWSGMPHEDKKQAYAADITYGTNNEFGFDYLRDNMALSKDQRYQRGLHYAIVDEVDSILIDEARTPLIISGPADDSQELYQQVNKVVPKLSRQETEEGEGDFWVDEKQKQAYLSEEGMEHAEQLLYQHGVIGKDTTLYDSSNLLVVHHLNAALRAHAIYQRDVDYIIRDGEVVIVDEFTGRTLPGRRWSDGLHQAVEAKEGVNIQHENQTLATVTFQNLFRMYDKLSGMTGTADTEAAEFNSIYGLEVVIIPTNKPMIRDDRPDLVFLTQKAKYKAVAEDIKERHAKGQPVLVGTTSIEVSELLSAYLKKSGVQHEVLNAKQHEREAQIVAEAGAPGSVTIATNMAGRGTDIVLGGSTEMAIEALGEEADAEEVAKIKEQWHEIHEQVKTSGGLHIIGTERHESRRIDNQLRGRSGRQGDPGSSRFYLSLEDNLLRIFGGDNVGKWMRRFGMKEDDALEERMISRQIEKAQRKVEQHNFDIRKHLLEYDDTANEQRKVIYRQRAELLESDDVSDLVNDVREDVLTNLVHRYVPRDTIDDQWNVPGLDSELKNEFGVDLDLVNWVDAQEELSSEGMVDYIMTAFKDMFDAKEGMIGEDSMRQLEKHVMLSVLDDAWKEHLAAVDYLRQGINLRGYAQQDPKQVYKRESFELFAKMLENIKFNAVKLLSRLRVRSEEEVAAMEAEQQRQAEQKKMHFSHDEASAMQDSAGAGSSSDANAAKAAPSTEPFTRDGRKIGRNELCPCGSGKKYKHCHGRLA